MQRGQTLRGAAVLGALALGASMLSACSSSAAAPLNVVPVPTSVTVTSQVVGDLGSVLTSDGRPLYVFSPDHKAVVTCTGACSGTWPPLRATGSARAGAGINAADLGTAPATGLSGHVVTFRGWPLYFYAGDVTADGPTTAPSTAPSTASPTTPVPASSQARGQALFLNGGPWYVIRADGEIVTTGSDHS